MRKAAFWVALVLVAVAAGKFYGCAERKAGERDAKDKADRKHAEELIKTNDAWLKAWPKLRADAIADADSGAAARARADGIGIRRRAAVTPPPAAPDSAWAAYWRGQAADLQLENAELRVAYEDQKRAFAKLLPAADTSAGRLDQTDEALALALERERMKGRFRIGLGLSLPKPPKAVAGLIGCAAGVGLAALITKEPEARGGNAVKGCGIGGATAVITIPTD